MHPELFQLPFTELTVKSYGFMLVVGFLAAIFVIRRLSRTLGDNPEHITNAALYSLIVGIVGARTFYVIHYWENFKYNPVEVFYVWQGGLELLGGVIPAIAVIIWYLRSKNMPIRKYMDILAAGLAIALVFGRIGCLLNGCCYGKPADMSFSVRFPYNSIPYHSQAFADPDRERARPRLQLPSEYYFNFYNKNGDAVKLLVPEEKLTPQQSQYLHNHDLYRCLPVHPTQIYSSLNALLIFIILIAFLKRARYLEKRKIFKRLYRPGTAFGLLFVLYGPTRFFIETLRDDNPFELGRLTVSQLLGIGMFTVGIVSMIIFSSLKPQQEQEIE